MNKSFYKDYLIGMLNNLALLNNIKLFQDTEYLYLAILNELQEIKDLLQSDMVENNIIRYSNHITPDNISYILTLLLGEEWYDYYDSYDLDALLFITRFIKPISVWDSEHHLSDIPYKYLSQKLNDNTMKSKSSLTKNIIDSLLGSKKSDEIVISKSNSIIINQSHINNTSPTILKTINDMIQQGSTINSLKNSSNKRTTNFNKTDCINIMNNMNIMITKNNKSTTLIEDKSGVLVYIKYNDKVIVIQGLIKDDLINISFDSNIIKTKINDIKETLLNPKIEKDNFFNIPIYFKNNYLNILSLRDIITISPNDIMEDVTKKYNDYKSLQMKPLLSLINEFLLASKYRKIDILTLLLMSNEEDQKLAFILFDVFKTKDKKDVSTEVYNALHHTIRELLDCSRVIVEKDEQELLKITESDIPYEKRISMMKTDNNIKSKAIEKLKAMKTSFQGDSKAQSWLDGLLKIPFNIYSDNIILNFKKNFLIQLNNKFDKPLFSDNDIDNYLNTCDSNNIRRLEWEQYKVDKCNYMKEIRATLDSVVYGHNEAKLQLERIFAQWINGNSKGAVLGLQGPPGTGKTSLAKNGLSKCLKDINGNPRPFAFLPIGGSVNGSTLVGHNFTYVGSTWGRIADILMSSGCMNPIIFIDEVDKISHTEHGKEIISILTHLTDSTQNDEFEDKFFSGIKLDLSKALIVFSFNDMDMIDPILRDRITIIETKALSLKEKLTIIKDYMLPEICKDIGFNKHEIMISDNIITFLIDTYTNEAGVRKIKEKLVEIVRDINLNRFHDITKYKLPFNVTKEYIVELFENKPKVRTKLIHTEPGIGIVNGLYATSSGIGGITPIQVMKFPSTKMLELNITGKAGEVMKESVEYSLKNAYSLLSKEVQDKLLEDNNNKKTFGLHIHFPDGATPKDGPSAGLAITLAFYSILMELPVRNDICMTGEIDLRGNAGIIGGLESKLNGAKKAGCKLALIPFDNMEDMERIRREGNSPECDNFKVIPVNSIKEVLDYAIIL
jgi:ATP-dependent Lon protease